MQIDDVMQMIGVMSKLNQTIDAQQQLINAYQKKYGPLDLTDVGPLEDTEKQNDADTGS